MSARALVTAALAAISLSACGGGGSSSEPKDGKLTVYSGRAEKLVGPLLERFEKQSGIDLDVRYGESAELAATIAEEGDASPAEVFFAQDAGALGAVEKAGLFAPLPSGVAGRVDERFVDPRGTWVGTSGRARVLAHSKERLKPADLPKSVFELTDPKWKGRVGFAPPNASFQSFISGMRLTVGDAKTRQWLEAMKANEPTLLENNIQTEEAIASGEIDVGLVNHYYVFELAAEKPGFPVANHFLEPGDPGSLVNVAGAGVLKDRAGDPDATKLLTYLLSEDGQRYFAEKTFEYPLVPGIDRPAGLPPLDDIQGPEVKLGDLGEKLRSTLELLQDVGLGS